MKKEGKAYSVALYDANTVFNVYGCEHMLWADGYAPPVYELFLSDLSETLLYHGIHIDKNEDCFRIHSVMEDRMRGFQETYKLIDIYVKIEPQLIELDVTYENTSEENKTRRHHNIFTYSGRYSVCWDEDVESE